MTKTVLITGANRGLGLEFVRQYAEEGAFVMACCRHPDQAAELQDLQKIHSNIELHSLDVSSQSDRLNLKEKIGKKPVDILINNAGMLEKESAFGEVSVDTLNMSFLVNAVAPLKLTELLIDNIARSKRKLIVCISSSMGSISDNTSGGYYSYRASKTALNMLMKSAGIDLASQGIQVLLLHPGWVKTRMGGNEAMIEPKTSIAGMRKVIENYSPEKGEVRFYRYNGEIVAW